MNPAHHHCGQLYHGIRRCYSRSVHLALFALATLAGQSPQPLVLIPLHENEAECVVHERVAAVLELVPEVRVLRAAKQKGEKLDAARARLKADLALARDTANLAAAGKSTKAQPLGNDSFAALVAVWPPNFPPLPQAHAMGAANPDALMAACRNDSLSAYLASGPAVGPVLRSRLDPPGSANLRVLERWAHASAMMRRGDHKKAIPVLKLVVESLARGIVGPVWRRPSTAGTPPSSLSLFGDLLIAFEAGTFVALDPTSGEERWRTTLGTAEPDLIEADKVLLAILENKIAALDPKNGKTTWTVELISPHPEIVVYAGRIFAAGVEEMVAIDPVKGEVGWHFDPLDDVAAGPSLVGGDLALPASTFVHIVGVSDGKEKKRIDTKDEISSPLAVTAKGAIWALVGSDEVVQISPEKGEVVKRVTRFPGADWPPAVGGERLMLAARRGRRSLVAYFDASVKSGLIRLYPGASSPLVALPNQGGVVHPSVAPLAIIARNLDGKPLWTAKQKASVESLSSFDGVIAGATGSRAIMLDHKRGQLIRMIELDGRITEVVLGPKGAAAILDKGTIYGLPAAGDPRPARWLQEARMDLARAHLALKQRPAALVLVRAVLAKNPNQLDALALRAEISESVPGAAVVDWLDLVTRAPKGDAMVARAGEALAKLGGIETRLSLDRPIEDLAVSGDTMLLLVEGAASARPIADPAKVLWTKPAKAIAATAEGFDLDGTLHDRAGKPGLKRGKDQRFVGDALFSVEGKALAKLDAAGKPKWKQTFDLAVDVLAADTTSVLVGDAAEGVQLLDAATGARKWLLPIGGHADAAWLGKDTVLVRTANGYRGLALSDGKTRFDLKLDPGSGSPVAVTSTGYLVGVGRKIILVDERGRQRPIVTAAKVSSASGNFVALEDGVLNAVSIDKAQITGRLRIGPFKTIAKANGKLLALRSEGSLLVIDAGRGLKSR